MIPVEYWALCPVKYTDQIDNNLENKRYDPG